MPPVFFHTRSLYPHAYVPQHVFLGGILFSLAPFSVPSQCLDVWAAPDAHNSWQRRPAVEALLLSHLRRVPGVLCPARRQKFARGRGPSARSEGTVTEFPSFSRRFPTLKFAPTPSPNHPPQHTRTRQGNVFVAQHAFAAALICFQSFAPFAH